MCFFADDHRKIDIEIDEVERTPLHLYNVASLADFSLPRSRDFSSPYGWIKISFQKGCGGEDARKLSGRVKTARVGWDAKPRKKMSS